MDVEQSKRKYLADGNDNIADQTNKTSALLLAQSTDPIIAKLKFPVCNSICDVETADSASVQMNDNAMNDEDDPQCQHLIDFTCNLICVINAQICSCTLLPA